jgi:hypothetical protein
MGPGNGLCSSNLQLYLDFGYLCTGKIDPRSLVGLVGRTPNFHQKEFGMANQIFVSEGRAYHIVQFSGTSAEIASNGLKKKGRKIYAMIADLTPLRN